MLVCSERGPSFWRLWPFWLPMLRLLSFFLYLDIFVFTRAGSTGFALLYRSRGQEVYMPILSKGSRGGEVM